MKLIKDNYIQLGRGQSLPHILETRSDPVVGKERDRKQNGGLWFWVKKDMMDGRIRLKRGQRADKMGEGADERGKRPDEMADERGERVDERRERAEEKGERANDHLYVRIY